MSLYNKPGKMGASEKGIDRKTLLDSLESRILDADDIFAFRCRSCGKCCKQREDLLLTSRDLFNIAKKLGIRLTDVIQTHCTLYIGHDSGLPLVQLQPVGAAKACPLLVGTKCSVHDAKPAICALYPLGRIYLPPAENTSGSQAIIKYFLQETNCGSNRKKQTVRSWLAGFGLSIDDPFLYAWNNAITYFCSFIHECQEKKLKQPILSVFIDIIGSALYTKYDTEQEFLPQFQQNVEMIKSMLEITKTMSAEELEQRFMTQFFC